MEFLDAFEQLVSPTLTVETPDPEEQNKFFKIPDEKPQEQPTEEAKNEPAKEDEGSLEDRIVERILAKLGEANKKPEGDVDGCSTGNQ